ncbi:NAD(P)/FAD-dependent oxidoreductase [Streptosporangium saharense]|uniref:NADPH-dependent 2,4-dienoyl-CoA reductase/sulfur reductase-like enzyme n=1 Tax=Streptosporangium saharense TaxID=1706840 RepID=A0A7W7VQU5_9ACTN|nr:FAD-dependent oxidoreductase [Streptosporangium saharense]MBB4918914.1 NADPH-dependent 2,4-dienoyl-CoA reductase/sulfur reductase-like enzyme [Streptosporangium saharense]
MGETSQTIVVAGGSLAGHTVVTELERHGFAGQIVWVRGREGTAPYSRPALSKELIQGKVTAETIRLPVPQPYGPRVRIMDGAVCAGLDPHADRVLVTQPDLSERWIDFDALFVCTGTQARVPEAFAGLPGVHSLRTLADAERIKDRLAVRPRTVVVGAGLVGSEMAASLRSCGLPVELIVQGQLPMEAVFGAELGRFCLERHHANGVTTRLGATVTALTAEGPVTLTYDDGESSTADMVVLGLGAVTSCDWLDGCGLDLSDGLGCDEALRTARPNILAAGDVANWRHPLFGHRMRVEHWSNASAQARHAVESWLAGQEGRQPPAFADVPYFWSDQYGLKYQMVGHARGHDEVHVEEAGTGGYPFVTYLRGGRIVAAAGVNAPRAVMRMKARIQADLAGDPTSEEVYAR